MISLTRPRWGDIDRYVRDLRDAPLSYGPPGLTRGEFEADDKDLPGTTSFRKDTLRLCLGSGREIFAAACRAVAAWRMFPETICRVYWPSPTLEMDHVVGVLFSAPGFWTLNPCRIVAVAASERLYGFAYGTLPGHLAAGEEAFLIRHRDDDSVWYELTVFSRPQQWLSWVGYPYMRSRQRRFRIASGRAMTVAVAEILRESSGAVTAPAANRPPDYAFSQRTKKTRQA